MKVFSKYMFIAIIGCLTFMACSDDDKYSAGPQNEGPGVSFGTITANATSTYLPADDPKIVLSVYRDDVTLALDVPIKIISNDSIDNIPVFNIPQNIHFNAGQETSSLEITFPTAELGKTYSFEIGIPDDYKHLYATNILRRNIMRDYDWKDYSGTLVTEFDGIDSEVLIQKADGFPIWRVVDPFKDYCEENGMEYDYSSLAQYITFYVNEDKSVTFDTYRNDLYTNGEQIYAFWPLELNASLTEEAAMSTVIDSYKVQLAPYYYIPQLSGGFGVNNVYITLDEDSEDVFGDFGELPEDNE